MPRRSQNNQFSQIAVSVRSIIDDNTPDATSNLSDTAVTYLPQEGVVSVDTKENNKLDVRTAANAIEKEKSGDSEGEVELPRSFGGTKYQLGISRMLEDELRVEINLR